MGDQAGNCFPSLTNLGHEAVDFFQGFQIVAGVHIQQTTCHVAVEFVQIVGQIPAFIKVQCTLQAQHNAAGAGNALGLFANGTMLDMTTRSH